MEEITAIINCFRRPYTLDQQYAAIKAQTVPPKEIMVWRNHSEANFNRDILDNCVTAESNSNFGVWGRFAYALNAKSEYIAIYDDDTVPGPQWHANCIRTIKEVNGLLCTIGIVFNTPEKYIGNCRRIGWDRPNEVTERVDFGGHCWFFKREWLSAFWRELPDFNRTVFCGEDQHFSYSIQKYLGLNTYVPPHPMSDRSLWGSQPETALRFGGDDKSMWGNNMGNAYVRSEEDLQRNIQNGWKLLCMENK